VYQHPATPFVYEFLGDVNPVQAASTPGRMKSTCIATLPSRALSRPRSSIAPRGPWCSRESSSGTSPLVPGEDVYLRPRVRRVFEPPAGRSMASGMELTSPLTNAVPCGL